jgi:hypothetical protein
MVHSKLVSIMIQVFGCVNNKIQKQSINIATLCLVDIGAKYNVIESMRMQWLYN